MSETLAELLDRIGLRVDWNVHPDRTTSARVEYRPMAVRNLEAPGFFRRVNLSEWQLHELLSFAATCAAAQGRRQAAPAPDAQALLVRTVVLLAQLLAETRDMARFIPSARPAAEALRDLTPEAEALLDAAQALHQRRPTSEAAA
jgi:hypothetical protein